MSGFFSYENLAHLAGFAGFLLSLGIAIYEAYQRRARLSVSSASAYACEAQDGRIIFLLRCVISNCSSLSFALTGFSFGRFCTREISAVSDRVAVMEADNDPSSVLTNDPIPIPIGTYGAVRCGVLFAYNAPLASSLCPPKLRRREFSFDTLNPFAKSNKQVDSWRIHLFITTSRGKRIAIRNLKVSMLSTSQIRAILDQRLDRKYL